MRTLAVLLLVASTPLLQACLAKAAFDVATAPVRVASKAVDLATTSQSEADEKRGREIRKREERLGKLERDYEEQREDCIDGDRSACEDARKIRDEMQVLLPYIPLEPDDPDRDRP